MAGPMPDSRRPIGIGLLMVVDHGLRALLAALMMIWMARVLGPQAWGLLATASALAAFGLVVMSLGLDLPCLRLLVRADAGDNAQRTLWVAMRLRCLAAVGWLTLLGAVLLTMGASDRPMSVVWIASLSVLAAVPSVVELRVRARGQVLPLLQARLAASVVGALLRAAILLSGADWTLLAWALVIETALASLWLLRSARSVIGGQPVDDRPDAARPGHAGAGPAVMAPSALLRSGLPLLLTAVITTVHLRADLVLLEWRGAAGDAGVLAVLQRLADLMVLAPVLLTEALWTPLAKGTASDEDAQRLFDVAAASAMLTVALAALVGPALLVGLLGPAYADAARLLPLHGLVVLPLALEVAQQRWLAAQGLQHLALVPASVAALASVAANAVLAPVAGAAGAVLVALVTWTTLACVPWGLRRAAPGAATVVARHRRLALWPWGRLLAQPRRPGPGAALGPVAEK
ncbi:MAG: oligosaccharide flippase family protein [Aquabacterium sp.]